MDGAIILPVQDRDDRRVQPGMTDGLSMGLLLKNWEVPAFAGMTNLVGLLLKNWRFQLSLNVIKLTI